MGAYERAGAALYALVHDDFGNENGNAALFVFGGAGGNVTVGVELRRLELVAFKVKNRLNNFLIVGVVVTLYHFRARGCVCPSRGYVYFNKVVARRRVYCVIVHLNYGVTLSAERLFSHILHIFDSFVVGHNLGIYAEERGL